MPAPTTRSDFTTTGWTITERHEVWTMQEPFGAYTWYAVNDQPSDKALYDFTIRVPAPWTGVANGTMTSREEVGDDTVTEFHLDGARGVVPRHDRDRRLPARTQTDERAAPR